MRSTPGTSLRAAIAVGLALVGPGVIEASWVSAKALVESEMLWKRLVVGGFIGAALDRVVFDRVRVCRVFVHEITHAAVALLLGRRVEKIAYGSEGGHVVYRGDFGGAVGGIVISLAPYTFPIFAVIAVGMRPLLLATVPAWGAVAFDVLTGVVLKLQLLGSLHDLRNNWCGTPSDWVRGKRRTDIEKNGTAFSMLYVGVAGLAVWGVLCAMLTGGYAGAALWGEIVAARTQAVAGGLAALAGIETLPDVAGLLKGT